MAGLGFLVFGQNLCCSTKMKSEFRNWSDVRIFLSVFRKGSTLAASRELGVAQPTVARRIEVLENECGLALFQRDTRGYKPTDEARTLYPLAEALEHAAREFIEMSDDLRGNRTVRITAPDAFSPQSMDILTAFVAANPGISFEFIPSVKPLDLSKGEADIAIRITKAEPDETLICRKISTAKWSMFGAQSYADKLGLPRSVEDLQNHRFVTFQNAAVPPYLHDWLSQHVAPEQIIMSFSELELMKASIRAGHGLGLVNLRVAATDKALIECFGPIEELSRQNLILISPEAWRRPEVKEFTKFFAPRYAATFR